VNSNGFIPVARGFYILSLAACVSAVSPVTAVAQAPDLVGESLAGEAVSLRALTGKGPVLLTFWALWCAPCKEELRAVQGLYDRYRGRGFAVIAVNQDSPRSLAKVRAYISSQAFSFPVIRDPEGRLLERFGGQAIPYSLLFTRTGELAHKAIGYLPGDEPSLEAEIVKVLGPE
jgi:peroxiredoxin